MKITNYLKTVLLFLMVGNTCFAQETIFTTGQERIYGTGTTRYTTLGSPIERGDSVYFNITTHTGPDDPKGSLIEYASFFMSFDQNGKLGTVILHPDTNNVEADSVYLNKMGASINPNTAFLAYRDAGRLEPKRKAITFGVYDITNRSVVQQVPLDTAGKLWFHIVTDFAQDSSHLIIGGGVIIDPFSTSTLEKFYSVYYANYNLLYTKIDSSSGGGFYGTIKTVKDKFFILHLNSSTTQFEVLNADLTTDTIIARPPSYPFPSAPHRRFDFNVLPDANGKGFYMLSFYGTANYAVVKFNEDYSVARIDSFPIKDANFSYAVPWKKPFDWNTPDTIYGIAGFYPPQGLNPWNGADSVGRTEPFRVVQFDTSGTVHWSRIVGRDSAVYFPYQVVATNDGGALIFSWLYDAHYSTSIHSRLSVIKIGANGDVLHQNEYDIPTSTPLALYPNPAKDKLYMPLPKDLESPGSYRIFSISGGAQISGRYAPGEPLEVEQLKPGNYVLHLQLDNGLVRAGRFIKE